jgi:hypothetical protein
MSFIPIEGKDGYFRDTRSNAIINTNQNEYNTYMMNYKKLSSDKERINDIENELGGIKGDLSEIKTMLNHFMDKHK